MAESAHSRPPPFRLGPCRLGLWVWRHCHLALWVWAAWLGGPSQSVLGQEAQPEAPPCRVWVQVAQDSRLARHIRGQTGDVDCSLHFGTPREPALALRRTQAEARDIPTLIWLEAEREPPELIVYDVPSQQRWSRPLPSDEATPWQESTHHETVALMVRSMLQSWRQWPQQRERHSRPPDQRQPEQHQPDRREAPRNGPAKGGEAGGARDTKRSAPAQVEHQPEANTTPRDSDITPRDSDTTSQETDTAPRAEADARGSGSAQRSADAETPRTANPEPGAGERKRVGSSRRAPVQQHGSRAEALGPRRAPQRSLWLAGGWASASDGVGETLHQGVRLALSWAQAGWEARLEAHYGMPGEAQDAHSTLRLRRQQLRAAWSPWGFRAGQLQLRMAFSAGLWQLRRQTQEVEPGWVASPEGTLWGLLLGSDLVLRWPCFGASAHPDGGAAHQPPGIMGVELLLGLDLQPWAAQLAYATGSNTKLRERSWHLYPRAVLGLYVRLPP